MLGRFFGKFSFSPKSKEANSRMSCVGVGIESKTLSRNLFDYYLIASSFPLPFHFSRSGKAVRLTYDHKGSDPQEAKRITDSGGFVMNNRVNGVLAVTRSLGDSAMKDFVVGSPYTTETTLGKEDSFLIVACDGVSTSIRSR